MHAGRFQIVDEHAGARHHAGQRVDEIVEIVLQHVGPFVSITFTHQGDAVIIRHAAVQFIVDVVEAGNIVVKELFNKLVAIAGRHHGHRIPVDEHVAEIENHIGDRLARIHRSFAVSHEHVVLHIRLSRPTLHMILHSLLCGLMPNCQPV